MWLIFALLSLDGTRAAALPLQRARLSPSLVETAKEAASEAAPPAASPAQPAAPAASALRSAKTGAQTPVSETVAVLQTADGTLTSKTRAVMSRAYERVVQPVQGAVQQYSVGQLLVSHIIILTLLGFVWAFVCQGNQRSTMLVSRDDLSGDFKPIGLCSCISMRAMNVAEALCCSLFMWAETAAKIGVGSFGFLLAAVIFMQVLDNALIMVGGPAQYLGYVGGLLYLAIRLWTRNKMRKDLKQASNSTAADALYDCLSHLCCTPCAIAQEAEFVEHYEKHYPLPQEV